MAKVFSSSVQTTVVTPNNLTFVAQQITIGTTAVALPSIVIPDGVTLVVKSYAGNGNKRLFVSDSLANVVVPATRNELRSGEAIGLSVVNVNVVFVVASAAGTILELMVEQG
jgi:hypothetical protein